MKTATTHTSIVKDYADYVDCSKRMLAQVKKNAAALKATIDLLNRRCALVDDNKASMNVWTNNDIWAGTIIVKAAISVATDSMIEGVVPQILKAMLDIECDSTTSKDIATESGASRIYRFHREASEHFLAINVVVTVTIQETDTGTCRKIQTGTKMVEVAEYAIECTGATA